MMGWQQVFLAECFGTAILIFNVFATIDHPMPGRYNTDDRYEDEDYEDEDDRYEDED
jgi:glycerol uptake facilitator-like aquaporin